MVELAPHECVCPYRILPCGSTPVRGSSPFGVLLIYTYIYIIDLFPIYILAFELLDLLLGLPPLALLAFELSDQLLLQQLALKNLIVVSVYY